ncbi:hypothetical protein JB92DRAFT_3004115 [Gautieria morchelliformis]|nr:hypothetical protein JB92DRAFT_3004115 [Gautieria morchelliformis]
MDSQIAELTAGFRVNIINSMAATTLLLYEILITSGQEIRYIWLSSWTKINVLHILIRYYALGYLLISAYCDTIYCSVLIFIGLEFLPSKTMPDPLPGILPGCFLLESAFNTSKVLVIALIDAFQAIYFSLTMYKLFIRVKSLGFSMTPILKVFFRDGVGYCLMWVSYFFSTRFTS